MKEISAILQRAQWVLSVEDHAKLKGAIDRLAFARRELHSKQSSMTRLRRLLCDAPAARNPHFATVKPGVTVGVRLSKPWSPPRDNANTPLPIPWWAS
jgi:hypothetical protein